jgi:glycosyltransferase involved in cell wall biosynthesis
MRVLLDCRMADWSGVGRYTTGLARALGARADVDLVELRGPGTETVPERAEVIMGGRHPFGPRGGLELARVVRHAGVDVVHCPHFPTPIPARGPLVVTLHDLIPLIFPGVMPSALKRAAYYRWNRRAARVAGRLIVPSASTTADVERLLPGSRGRIRVVPEAADDFSHGPVGPLGEKLARLALPPYLLSMGNTRRHKDLPTLLRAFAELAAGRALRLLLVGPEPPGYLDRQMQGMPPQVRARVSFTGPIGDDALRALYAWAIAFVFPSQYEGFGLPVLEAMAFGIPVVCADAASLPEVADEAARYFPPGDAPALAATLAAMVDDPSLREDLSGRGLKRAADFTWEKTAAATVAVYQEAIGCS